MAPSASAPPMVSAERAAPSIIDCDVRLTTPKPIHVAFALGGTDLGRSGIGTYVREVLPELVVALASAGGKLTAFGHRSELEAFEAALHRAEKRRVRFVPVSPSLNALWYLRRAGTFATKLGAEVLLLPAANRRIAASATIPTVAVVHDLAQLRVDQKYDRLRMAYFHRVLVPSFRQPTRLVAVSRATADDLERSVGIPAERIRVVYNGVNTSQFRALTPAAIEVARSRAEIADKPYLLYPARLEHPGKNHVRLLEAFARSGLAATHTLALTGGDWGAAALIETTVARLGLGAAVRRLGFVSSEDLAALIAGADAVLMLGLHEGFGLPALEGLSAGRPVCVSNTGALPEVVGPLGAQCDPLSVEAITAALTSAVRNESLRAQCAVDGPAWAERFTWKRTAAGLLEACHEAVEIAQAAGSV